MKKKMDLYFPLGQNMTMKFPEQKSKGVISANLECQFRSNITQGGKMVSQSLTSNDRPSRTVFFVWCF